ncbi:hypothetical protein BJ742DRAFT_117850 [Cladochytrium replicatum]|nr:hypothetical protein BJ742DRAFT_117850 [Cladochytrium replicatum]
MAHQAGHFTPSTSVGDAVATSSRRSHSPSSSSPPYTPHGSPNVIFLNQSHPRSPSPSPSVESSLWGSVLDKELGNSADFFPKLALTHSSSSSSLSVPVEMHLARDFARVAALFDSLETLEKAAPDYLLPYQEAYVKSLKQEVVQKRREVEDLGRVTRKEWADVERYRKFSVRLLLAKLKGRNVAQKIEKETAEFMGAYEKESQTRRALDLLEAQLKEAVKTLEKLGQDSKALEEKHKELDRVILKIFTGPTPDHPEEDELELLIENLAEEHKSMMNEILVFKDSLRHLENAITELDRGIKAVKAALKLFGIDSMSGLPLKKDPFVYIRIAKHQVGPVNSQIQMAYKLLSTTPLTSSLSQYHGNAATTSPMLSLSAAAFAMRRDPGSDDPPPIDEIDEPTEDNTATEGTTAVPSAESAQTTAADVELDLADLEEMEEMRAGSTTPTPGNVNGEEEATTAATGAGEQEGSSKPPTPPQSPLHPVATALITTLSSFAPGTMLSEPLVAPSIVDTLSQAITRMTDDYIRDELLNSLMAYTEHRRRINNAKEEVSLLMRKQTFRANMAEGDLEIAQKRIRELRRHILERGVEEFRMRKLGRNGEASGFRFRKSSGGSVKAGSSWWWWW